MDNEMITKTATSLQLERIADALDTIIKMVKEDQERSRKYMEDKKDE